MGKRIREERIKRKLTIEQLSELIDVSPSFLGLVERGYRGLSIEKLVAIAEAFDISIDSLLKTTDSDKVTKYDTIKPLLYNLDDNEFDFISNMIKESKKLFKIIDKKDK
ncbi:helix-turn-helix domain-containing protein [Paramaledivibacter caminithermalis]|jgi:transcriptional regulator with XRE-family HTH domain|nr:helix-turn-helix transcriptional regulator [Paramaledivibacter caminithermalis]